MSKHYSAAEKPELIKETKTGKYISQSRRLSAREKMDLISRYLSGAKITHLCQEAGVSRTIFYKWLTIYKQTEQAVVIKQLASRRKRGRTHYRAIPFGKEHAIVKTALKNPSFSLRKIASLVYCSRHSVWTVLKEHNLNTRQLREAHVQTIGRRLKLPLDTPLKLTIMRRLEAGEPVSALCREFGVSRTVFYQWVQHYTQAIGEKRQAALVNRRPKAETHYRYNSEARQMVLDIVLADPHLSIRKIQQELVRRAGSRALSRHGVHSILRAYHLNSQEKRLLFAAAHKQANDANSL